MIFRSATCEIFRSNRLVLGILLGLMAVGGTAQAAAANPLQAIPIVGELIRATRPAPQLPTDLDIFHDNVQGNHINVCTLTCGPIPGARPPAPPAPPVSQGVPRPPQPQSAQPTGAPRPSGTRPAVTVNMPPINIPL